MDSAVQCDRTERSEDISPRGASPAAVHLPTLSEMFCVSAADAGATGFVTCGLWRGPAPVLWVQDRISRREAGLPYLPGLAGRPVVQVDANRPVDVLWALEQGLSCPALSAVIGEIWGTPAALDFTATKRLALRAERHGLPCWLIRRAAAPDLSAARNRWRVASLPSAPDPHDPRAPGAARWQVELFRSRGMTPGQWEATHDRAADRVDFSAALRDGALAEGDDAQGRRAMR